MGKWHDGNAKPDWQKRNEVRQTWKQAQAWPPAPAVPAPAAGSAWPKTGWQPWPWPAPWPNAKAKAKKKEDEDPTVAISKYLSGVLRHNAVELGLEVREDGYVSVAKILELEYFKTKGLTEQNIRDLVEMNEKKRFGLKDLNDELHIRAHQGHSINHVQDTELLEEIPETEELQTLCHGTFSTKWDMIKEEGLRTMGRNHIHLVSKDLSAEENRTSVISGTRGDFDTIVFVATALARAEGITFFRSENDVVLTRGLERAEGGGYLPTWLFEKVMMWDRQENRWNCADT